MPKTVLFPVYCTQSLPGVEIGSCKGFVAFKGNFQLKGTFSCSFSCLILQAEGDSRGGEAQSHFSPSPFKVPGPSNRTETPGHGSGGIALSLATCGFLVLSPGLRHSHREVTAQTWFQSPGYDSLAT